MSEPNSASDPTPPVPPAPSFTYGSPAAEPSAPPQYGERLPAPVGQPAPAAVPPAYGPTFGQPPVKRRRTWDLVLTVILLVVGFFGMLIGLFYAAIFADPELVKQAFDQAYSQSGLGSWDGSVGAVPAIIAVSHIVLYLAALGVSILLLVKNKVAFWVPLTAGVVAAIVFWGAIFAIVFSDASIFTVPPR